MRVPTGKLNSHAVPAAPVAQSPTGRLAAFAAEPAPAAPAPAVPVPVAIDPTEAARLAELQALGAGGLGAMPWTAAAQAASPIQAALDAQVANPASIAQARPNTCTATAMQILLATKDPTSYKAAVTDLLNLGRATLPNGAVLELSSANQAYLNAQTNLTPAQKIDMAFQAAAMDLGNGEYDYSLSTDKSTMLNPDFEAEDIGQMAGSQKTAYLKSRQLTQVGLDANQLSTMNKVFGDVPRFTAPAEAAKASDPVAVTLDALSKFLDKHDGKPGAISVLGSHAVLVADVDVKAQTVSLLDGYGQTKMPGAQFYQLLSAARWSGIGNDTTMATTSTAYVAPPPPPIPKRR